MIASNRGSIITLHKSHYVDLSDVEKILNIGFIITFLLSVSTCLIGLGFPYLSNCILNNPQNDLSTLSGFFLVLGVIILIISVILYICKYSSCKNQLKREAVPISNAILNQLQE